jgi:hypothetical protein
LLLSAGWPDEVSSAGIRVLTWAAVRKQYIERRFSK